MNNFLEALEIALSKASNLADCDNALKDHLSKRHVTTFSFTYYAYHPNSANKLKYDTCSENFKAWHKHYLEQNYADIDSTLRFVYENHLPIYWNMKQQLAQAKNDTEKKMREDSHAFGVEEGLSIPVHGPHNDFAILLLVQMHGQSCRLNTAQTQYELFATAHIYYHYLQSHLLDNIVSENTFGLTQREMQCLYLLYKQLSVKELAQQLELTERTVHFHIQKLNKKLGTKNKYQSLAKALELRLLTI
ncbi:LuxR family transcriptional regulator [Legionella spiritensis]|uniref:LuxR family transcriptional regulator n=1 Tax=Legionella spiritensis TaxID=452 RepID=A0A0W0Z506_LEGSP|nr:LuxR family transcriptional regulator [Legionella spiritensis]KTD63919.1 LuxR family transcriptional regulator [Legionella spiritensis]SNV36532.1 LuxR family transcriptional regulator [Legionella spiritensis]VEG89955.1 LuxR family transcriptional regulator [Legionella spiritensis]